MQMDLSNRLILVKHQTADLDALSRIDTLWRVIEHKAGKASGQFLLVVRSKLCRDGAYPE